ncbi:MAG: hypothetical protein ACR2NT_11385 [Acidimicrobiia bacterium]
MSFQWHGGGCESGAGKLLRRLERDVASHRHDPQLRLGRVRATILAASIGRWLAVALVAVGLWRNLWLVIIGIYLFMAAGAERRAATDQPAITANIQTTIPKPNQTLEV